MRVPALCRDRATVVIVGDVGLHLDRTPFYQRELTLKFARSYGPGRYEPSYEAWGVDFPPGQVRWTEGRNFEAVLDLLASGRLGVADLVTHTFDIADAGAAYQLIDRHTEPYLAIRLTYPGDPGTAADGGPRPDGGIRLKPRPPGNPAPGIGWAGAGAFSTGTLLPAFAAAGFGRFVAVASASGVTARRAAERHGFEKAVCGADSVINDPDVGVVVIATPHDTHADLTIAALSAGRHVWCEKPVALSLDELDAVEKAWRESGRQLAIGFNRRWSPAVRAAQRALAGAAGPKLVVYRVAAGRVAGRSLVSRPAHGRAPARRGVPFRGHRAGPGRRADRGGDGAWPVAAGRACGTVTTPWWRSGSPTAHWPPSPTAAPSPRPARSGSRSSPGRTGWSSTTSGPSRPTARPSGRASQDKGHRAAVAAFRAAVAGTADLPAEAMLATMRATVHAADTSARSPLRLFGFQRPPGPGVAR